MIMFDDIVVEERRMYGGWRRAVNAARNMTGSLHDNETAQKLGWRGGAVAGIVNLNLFPPLLVKAFGQRWFERGSLSIFYTYALVEDEQVRAVIGLPPEEAKDTQVQAWAETPDGHTVGKGTVSVGEPEELSYLQSIELRNAGADESRILAGLKAGDELPSRDVLITQEAVAVALQTVTDSLDWYRSSSPWGEAIVPPTLMYSAMQVGPNETPEAVGFFGATELRNVNGPIKVGVPYRVNGKLACVGTSQKTEFYWFDSYLEEKDSGKRIAEMRHMTRFMKASSPLYPQSQV